MPVFVLYGRPACHLCQDMEAELLRWRGQARFELQVVDIDTDPALVERYGARVPVLVAGGEEVCSLFFDEVAFRRYLSPA